MNMTEARGFEFQHLQRTGEGHSNVKTARKATGNHLGYFSKTWFPSMAASKMACNCSSTSTAACQVMGVIDLLLWTAEYQKKTLQLFTYIFVAYVKFFTCDVARHVKKKYVKRPHCVCFWRIFSREPARKSAQTLYYQKLASLPKISAADRVCLSLLVFTQLFSKVAWSVAKLEAKTV